MQVKRGSNQHPPQQIYGARQYCGNQQQSRNIFLQFNAPCYARVPVAQVKGWTELVNAYLRGRPNLRRVCVLIDARHGLKDSDLNLMKMLDAAAVSYQIVLTKADKVKPAELARSLDSVAGKLRSHVAAHPEVHVTSAIEGRGVPELRAALAELALPA